MEVMELNLRYVTLAQVVVEIKLQVIWVQVVMFTIYTIQKILQTVQKQ